MSRAEGAGGEEASASAHAALVAEVRRPWQKSIPICIANRTFDKVFGIGANKTGTSSLAAIFAILGLNVAPQQEGSSSESRPPEAVWTH